MEVYEFNKTLKERYEELKIVFDSFVYAKYDKITSFEIHSLWVDLAEITIEPTGWTALWRASRIKCEELKIKYPTIIYGMVENVLYKELVCTFKIIAVEDEEICLPAIYEVPLDELYPTIVQENVEVNTSTTANGIDQMRFFYQFLWMPWDNESDDDINRFQKTIELRLEFYYDMETKRIDQCLVDHVTNLLLDARNIQNRIDYLELDLSDTEDDGDTTTIYTKDLLKLHLRMNMIKNQIEMLQNPKMRDAYKEVIFNCGDSKKSHTDSNNIYVVLEEGKLADKINYLKLAAKTVDNIKNVITCATLQEVLTQSNNPHTIYIPIGQHTISFHESLKNNGSIKTISNVEVSETNANAIISTADNELFIMSFDGDFTLENITLDCRNVETGILIKNGCGILNNCKLIGDGKSSVRQGIVTIGRATVKLINCVISNFAIGITLKPEANLLMSNTTISNCNVGISMEDGCELRFNDSKIMNSKSYGVYYKTNSTEVLGQTKQIFKHFDEINWKSLMFNQNFKFENNTDGNIIVYNKRMADFVAIKNNEAEETSIILIDDSYTDS